MFVEGSLFRLLTRDEPDYSMVVDLWVYRDGSIGFDRTERESKSGCDCTTECFRQNRVLAECIRSIPLRLANTEEYLAARKKTISTGIVLPLPNEFLPPLDPGDTVLLEQGLFWLGQNIELIPLTQLQQKRLLSFRSNERIVKLLA